MKKRFPALCLIFLLLWTLTLPVMAEDSVSGTCGEDLVWNLTGTTLTISGSGPMEEYDYSTPAPWKDYAPAIVHVVVEEGVTTIGSQAMSQCDKLLDVSLPASLTAIGENAFYYCDVLEEIQLPDGLTTLGRYVFQQCSMLQSITIPTGVTEIPDSAFYGCEMLSQVQLHDKITTIGSSAFHGCSSLESVTIPSAVTELAPGAFAGCSSLTQLPVEGSAGSYVYEQGALYNAEKTILVQVCCATERLELPDTLTQIGDYSLYGCDKLMEIHVPEGVTHIGAGAFGGCENLRYMVIPATVESLGYGALENGSIVGFSENTTDIYYGGDESSWNALMEDGFTDTEGVNVHFETTQVPQEPETPAEKAPDAEEPADGAPETVEAPQEESGKGFVIPVLIGAAVAILGLGGAAVVLRKKHTKTGA